MIDIIAIATSCKGVKIKDLGYTCDNDLNFLLKNFKYNNV
jgi:hypothetical protein